MMPKVVLLHVMCALYVGLALFVYIKGKNKNLTKGFSLFAGSLAFWTFGLAQIFSTADRDLCLFWANFLYVGGSFVASSFLLFSFIYPARRFSLYSLTAAWVVLPSVFLAILAFTTPYLVRDVIIVGEDRGFVYGPIRWLWELQFNSSLLYAFYRFFRLCAKAEGLQRKQLLYIVVSSLTINIFSGSTNVFLVWFGIYQYVWMGPPLTLIWFVIVFYAILRYRLMDIRVAVTSVGLFLSVYTLVLGVPVILGYKYGNWQLATYSTFVLATLAPFVYLHLQKRAAESLLWEQRRYQSTLIQASSGMGRIKDLRKLVKLIVRIVTRVVRVEHSAVYVYSKQARTFLLGSILSHRQADPFPDIIAMEHPLIKQLLDHRKPVLADEVAQRQLDAPSGSLKALSEGLAQVNASMVVPSFVEDRLIAILVLGQKISRETFSPDDLSVFTILGNQAALAIENALFYEDMKKTHEQLFKAEKMATIGIMADGLSHQINNRLHAMGFVAGDMLDTLKLKQGLFVTPELKELEQEFAKGLQRLEDNVKRGSDIVQGLMKYTRKGESGFSPVSIDAVISSAWDMAQFKIKAENMMINRELPQGLSVRGNFTQLQEVFFNLIDNAYDAMVQRKEEFPEDAITPTLLISGQVLGTEVELRVRDNGIGVRPEDIEKLFTPFFTTKATSRKGTGLGLYVIRKIIEENHTGRIAMNSRYCEGTEFVIYLPAAI